MKKYRITGLYVTINPGTVLELDERQAARRAHALEPGKRKGTYTTRAAVQFKRGEQLGIEGELPKLFAQDLEEDGAAGSAARRAPVKPAAPAEPGTAITAG